MQFVWNVYKCRNSRKNKREKKTGQKQVRSWSYFTCTPDRFLHLPLRESAMHISAKQASPTTSTIVELELQYRTLTFSNILSNMTPCMAYGGARKNKKEKRVEQVLSLSYLSCIPDSFVYSFLVYREDLLVGLLCCTEPVLSVEGKKRCKKYKRTNDFVLVGRITIVNANKKKRFGKIKPRTSLAI